MIDLTPGSNSLVEKLVGIPREDLFTVGDFVGTIPCYVPASVMMAYNRTRLNSDDDVAATWATELLLGREGFEQLLASDLKDEQLDQVLTAIIGRVRGATRGEPGKGSAGQVSKPATSSRRRSTATSKSN